MSDNWTLEKVCAAYGIPSTPDLEVLPAWFSQELFDDFAVLRAGLREHMRRVLRQDALQTDALIMAGAQSE